MRLRIYFIFLIFSSISIAKQSLIIEKIALYGNTQTKDNVILQELQMQEGDTLSNLLIEKDKNWLLKLGFLKRIELQIKKGSSHKKSVLMLTVQENNPWSAIPILDNNDLFGWYYGTTLSYNHLFGRRNRIDATFQFGGIQKFDLSWTEHRIGGKLNLFYALNLYYSSFRYLYSDYITHFKEKDTGFIFTLGKSIGRNLQFGIRTGLEHIWTENPTVTFSGNNNDYNSMLESFFTFDSRDWPTYPKTGLYFNIGKRWTEHHFSSTEMEIRTYSSIYHGNIIAVQSLIQLSRGTVPVYKRIHIGGGKTIRGYRTGSITGENCFLMSLEYRFPILYEQNPLSGINIGYSGVLFIDTGTAWFQHESLKSKPIKGSIGFGIHLIYDRLVLRAEYGTHGKGWGFITTGTSIKF